MQHPSFILKPDAESLGLNYSLIVDPVFGEGHRVAFYIRMICELSRTDSTDKNQEMLYNILYLCEVEITDPPEPQDDGVEMEEPFLSHLLGMSILMVRGAISIRVQSPLLQRHPFPVINPNEILSEKLAKRDGRFLLPLASAKRPVGDS